MNEVKERVFVIQPIESDRYRVLQEEAVALIESANADYAGTVYQKIREINPATYIGEGKAAEIAELISGLDVTILFNGELSPFSNTQFVCHFRRAEGDRPYHIDPGHLCAPCAEQRG